MTAPAARRPPPGEEEFPQERKSSPRTETDGGEHLKHLVSAGSARGGLGALLPEDRAEGSGRLYRLLVAALWNRAGPNLHSGQVVKDAGDSPNEVRFVDAGDLGH